MYCLERQIPHGWEDVSPAEYPHADMACDVAQLLSEATNTAIRVYFPTGKAGYRRRHNVALYSHGECVYDNR